MLQNKILSQNVSQNYTPQELYTQEFTSQELHVSQELLKKSHPWQLFILLMVI